MIQTIMVTNYLGESTTFDLGSPEKSGFFISGATGLGPVKATINLTDIVSVDGSIFNSSRVSYRNIVLSIGFLELPTIEETRQKSYRIFPIGTEVLLTITTDIRVLQISGMIESNEPDIFSKVQTAIVSIMCPNPYFRSPSTVVTLFSGINVKFKFPFSNESLTENTISFGEILTNSEENVYYSGDIETGINMYINAVGPVTDLAVYNSRTREVMRINDTRLIELTGRGIDSGDMIVISTSIGSKSIVLIRDGEVLSIMNSLDRDTKWIHITRGDNVFAYTVSSGFSNLQFAVENSILYAGV